MGMSEHQRETAFLRQAILYDSSIERRALEQSIAQVQRDQRCVQRLFWSIALFLLLALAGLIYGAILEKNFPYTLPELAFRGLCAALLASLICLVGLAVLFMFYHTKLNRLREDCRRVVKRLLESRLDKPPVATLPASEQVADDREATQRAAAEPGGMKRQPSPPIL